MKTILIIDNEPEILTLLKKRLEANQFKCVTAENPIDGLRVAVKVQPHLILLDLMLPKMSGFSFLRIVKRHPLLSTIPVIVFTACGAEGMDEEARKLGAVGFLTKTCSPEELISLLEQNI